MVELLLRNSTLKLSCRDGKLSSMMKYLVSKKIDQVDLFKSSDVKLWFFSGVTSSNDKKDLCMLVQLFVSGGSSARNMSFKYHCLTNWRGVLMH